MNFFLKVNSMHLYPIAAQVVEDDFESNLILICCRHYSEKPVFLRVRLYGQECHLIYERNSMLRIFSC